MTDIPLFAVGLHRGMHQPDNTWFDGDRQLKEVGAHKRFQGDYAERLNCANYYCQRLMRCWLTVDNRRYALCRHCCRDINYALSQKKIDFSAVKCAAKRG